MLQRLQNPDAESSMVPGHHPPPFVSIVMLWLVIAHSAVAAPPVPKAINLNFGIVLDDSNRIDSNELSVAGLNGAATIDGTGWNNALLRTSASGAPTIFTAATQVGSHIDLIDSSGSDAGVDLTSVGGFFANFGNVSSPNEALTGDAGLLQSYLLLSSSESIQLSGLSVWAANGYYVRAFFDIGPFTRTYGITMHDGGTPQAFWTADSAASDSDPDNDGTISWKQTAATTEGAAVADANHALFGPFTGNTLTISGIGSQGRAALSGLQVIPNSGPPATIVSFTATPASFTAGQTVTLNWQVSDADSVTISPSIGMVSATGSLAVNPSATTTWSLTATRGTTQVTAQATATLNLGPIAVYLLAGQSNMQGTALTSGLPSGFLSIPEIQLYAAGSGVSGSIANQWVTLRPANGSTFGPEIGIGERMRDLCPGQPIALLKYASSGTSLEIGWKPGATTTDTANWGPQFTSFVTTMNNGLAALEAKGWQPVIMGMCWQQGEQDAKDGLNVAESTTSADDYGANLKHFVTRVRQQFSTRASPAGIRFVPGQVLPYAPDGGDVMTRFPGRGIVRQATLDADEDSGAALSISNTRSIPTNSTDHPVHEQEIPDNTDEVHLGATAQLALGRSMAYAMLDLDPQTYLQWADSRNVVGGPDADDDHDGLTNRTEYMFGGIPTDAGSAPRPLLSFTGSGSNPTFTISRNLAASDLAPKVQFSPDLADWTSQPPVFISSVKQADGTAILSYQGPGSEAGHPRGFFRAIETAP